MNSRVEIAIDDFDENSQMIRDGILDFNKEYIGSKPDKYCVSAKNEQGEIWGGALVYAHISSVYIDVLWVKHSQRGAGIGKGLLQQVEQEAIRRHIPYSTVDTFDFQAEGFYLKYSYEQIGVIPKYIEGHDRVFLKKQLS